MCKWCEQSKDGGIELHKETIDLGIIGNFEITSSLWNFYYHVDDANPFLLFDVWIDYNDNNGEDLCEQMVPINYCPFCGRKLRGGESDAGTPGADGGAD